MTSNERRIFAGRTRAHWTGKRAISASACVAAFLAVTSSGCLYDFERDGLLAPGEVGGQAVRENGDVASFTTVSIEGLARAATARADGAFQLSSVSEGSWRLLARQDADGDGWPERAKVIGFRIVNQASPAGLFGVGDVQLSSVDLGQVTLDGTVRLAGEVKTEADIAAEGARVAVIRDAVPIFDIDNAFVPSSGAVEARAGTGVDGRFIVPAVAAGSFLVLAYAEANGAFLLSDVRNVTRLSGQENFEGTAALVVRPTTETRDVIFDVTPPPSGGLTVRVELTPAGGVAGEIEARVATPENGRFIVRDVAVGPWATQVRIGGVVSTLETRFVLPGDGAQDLGAFRVQEEGCDGCDCDGDGVPGLPPRTDVSTRACFDADFEALWDSCEEQCQRTGGQTPPTCRVQGVLYDCEDDLDGQQDVDERGCYGVGQGPDCDGDDLCGTFDPDDRCPNGTTCAPEDVVNLCRGSSSPPVDAGPADAGVDAGIDAGVDAGLDAGLDAGFDAGVDGGFDGGFDAGFDGGFDAGFDAGVDGGDPFVPVDAGVPVTGGFVTPTFVGWVPYQTVEVFFGQTATAFVGVGGTLPPTCPSRNPAVVAVGMMVAMFDVDGECLWTIPIPSAVSTQVAIASAPDQGLFLATGAVFGGAAFTVGQDSGGSDVTLPDVGIQDGLVLVHYDSSGIVLTTAFFPADEGQVTGVSLTSHPLAAGPVVAANFNAFGALPATLTIGNTTAGTLEKDFIVAFLDADFVPTTVVEGNAEDDNGFLEIGELSSLRVNSVAIVAVSSAGIFPGTSGALGPTPTRTFFAELRERTDPFIWTRQIFGLSTGGTIGASQATGNVVAVVDGFVPTNALVWNDLESGVAYLEDGAGSPSVVDFGGNLQTDSLVLTYDANGNRFLIFTAAQVGVELKSVSLEDRDAQVLAAVPSNAIVELEVTLSGDLYFAGVNGLGQPALFRDSIALDVNDTITLLGEAATDFAITPDGSSLFTINDVGELLRVPLKPDLGTPEVLATGFETTFVAGAGGGLLVYSDGTQLYSGAYDVAAGAFVATLEVDLQGERPIDIAMDVDNGIAYVLLESTGIYPYVLGSGVLDTQTGIVQGTGTATAVAYRNSTRFGFRDALGAEEFVTATGALHIVELDSSGTIVVDVAGGTTDDPANNIELRAIVGTADGYTVAAELSTGRVTFVDAATALPLVVQADDLPNTGGSLTPEAFIVRLSGPILEAAWVRQSETAEMDGADESIAALFVDGSASLVFPISAEGRAGGLRFVGSPLGDQFAAWRVGVDGGVGLPASTWAGIEDLAQFPMDAGRIDDVVLAADRMYLKLENVPTIGTPYFEGTPCEWTAGGGKSVDAVVALDREGRCVWLRGYLDIFSEFEIVKRPSGGLLILAANGGSIDVFNSLTGTEEILSAATPFAHVEALTADGIRDGRFYLENMTFGSDRVVPMAFPDGGFGIITRVNATQQAIFEDTTVSLENFVREAMFAVVAEPNGNQRTTTEFVADNDNAPAAAIGVDADSLLLLFNNQTAGTDFGGISVSVSAGDASVTRLTLSDGLATWVSTVTGASNLDRLYASPGGSQGMLLGAIPGTGGASFEFPEGTSPTSLVDFDNQLAIVFDANSGTLDDVIYSRLNPAIILDASISARDHITFALQRFVGAPSTELSSLAFGSTQSVPSTGASIAVVHATVGLNGPTEFGPFNIVNTNATRLSLGNVPYVQEVLFIETPDTTINVDGTNFTRPTAETDLPLAIPLLKVGVGRP